MDEDLSVKKHKKHKKKKRHVEEEDSPEGSVTSNDVSSSSSDCQDRRDKTVKKKKKPKKEKHGRDLDDGSPGMVKEEDVEEPTKKKHKKKKKKKDRECEDSELKHSKRRKSSEESGSSVDDDDDVTKKKKQKRSDACDREKSETDNSKPTINPELADPSKFGQWGSATFDDSKRQEKFLRLMGGFKKSGSHSGEPSACSNAPPPGGQKGLFGSLSTSGKKKGLFGSLQPSGSRADYTMDDERAKTMNQKLEDQFEQARNFRFNKKKGVGLGFDEPPEENKDFHIDKDSSNSVKFDD